MSNLEAFSHYNAETFAIVVAPLSTTRFVAVIWEVYDTTQHVLKKQRKDYPDEAKSE